MKRIINRVQHTWEMGFDKKAERFTSAHPYAVYLAVFIGLPLLILGAVFLSTALLMLPVGLLFGWF